MIKLMDRRQVIVAATAAAFGISTAGLTTAATAQDTLSVGGIYGGVWAKSIRESFLDPFAKKRGVNVQIEEGISAVTLAKLRQQKGNPQFDAVWMDRIVSDQAIREGLVEPIDPKALKNLVDVADNAIVRDKDGRIMALTTGFWAAGIAYNREAVKQAPVSWLDLADSRFSGRVALYSPENSIGLPLLVTLAELKGGGINNLDPGFEIVKQLTKNGALFFAGSPAGANYLASGEVDIASLASSQVWDLQSKGFPIEYVAPKEGAVAGDIRVHIVAGAKHKELAEELVDYVISAEAQNAIADRLFVGPVNEKTKLAPEVAKKMPWGENGSAKTLRLVDPYAILDHRDEWVARWNREVTQ
jgi:putative spermidine/putrescine transport system substrate-binding protein